MAEKRKYNAGLNRKGLEQSVSEEQAREMCLHQGSTHVFIIQAHAGPKTVAEDGSEVVSLIPDHVELVPAEHAERLRRYQRALYLARPDQFGQAAFEDATPGERDVEAAGADVDALVETDPETGEATGIWEPDTEPQDGEFCDYPGCVLPVHDTGDHHIPTDDAGGSVVEFSGKTAKAKA